MDIGYFAGVEQSECGAATHLLLVPGCKWVGAILQLLLCACLGMLCGDLHLLPQMCTCSQYSCASYIKGIHFIYNITTAYLNLQCLLNMLIMLHILGCI